MFADRLYARFSMAIGGRALRAIGMLNVPVYRATKGRLGGTVAGAPVLLLTTTGRRSGATRTAPVLYMRQGERLVVIGSNAGNARAPAWSLNLKANPDAEVEVRGRRRTMRARLAAEPERSELWRAMNEQYAGFDDYQAHTSRDIPVFVLEPR
ncbi:MAG TPA: nitroreductase family deazaflavin-dependent oxidoreductase [Solirubrobacteraceae bacterium]|nr:nitroreductase family deazaflavin-dependent oxidoreductase [Solirubrobacteraceae bacterium]